MTTWTSLTEYLFPRSVEEAVELFHRHGGSAAYLAGGTALVARRDPRIRAVIDLSRLPLSGVERRGQTLRIGSGVTLQALLEAEATRPWAGGLLRDALVATRTWIRRGGETVGGTLMAGDSLAEPLTAWATLDAQVELAGSNGAIPFLEFLHRRQELARQGGLITALLLPATWESATGSFLRLARIPSDPPILMVGAAVMKNGNRCEDLRLVVGGGGPLPIRLQAVETSLRGKLLANTLIQQAVQPVSGLLSPADDPRATAAYRAEVAPVLVRRAIERCADQQDAGSAASGDPQEAGSVDRGRMPLRPTRMPKDAADHPATKGDDNGSPLSR